MGLGQSPSSNPISSDQTPLHPRSRKATVEQSELPSTAAPPSSRVDASSSVPPSRERVTDAHDAKLQVISQQPIAPSAASGRSLWRRPSIEYVGPSAVPK